MATAFLLLAVACPQAQGGVKGSGGTAGGAGYSSTTPGGPGPAVTVAILPDGVDPEDFEGIEGLSPGTMSAGLATVTAAQTFLDIGAGNRVFTSLYGDELPALSPIGTRVPGWSGVLDRADSAPAEIVPGLLASSLQDGGVPIRADSLLVAPALMAANRRGRVERSPPLACLRRRCPGVSVEPATLGALPRLVERLRGADMLIAFERPPADEREVLAAAIAGRGFDGNMTSGTTRTPGFVLATDVAPTILDRYGIAVPDEMNGDPIRTEGEPDAGAVQDRADRMEVVAPRRKPVVLRNLIAWVLLAGLVALLSRGRLAAPASAVFGLSVVLLPVLLLAGAAVRPDDVLVERLIVGIGAPVLAAALFLALRGWAALAAACGIALIAYAVDMVAGSPLTAQSLLGPNPGLGVRFFGIGNELEASLAVAIPVGVGAGLAAAQAAGKRVTVPSAVIAFLVVGAASALVFASGRFGADVGAAIVFPAGAAVAALAVPGVARGNRRVAAIVIAAPFIGLAVLFLVDLVLGGDAHLSRSVLDAGSGGELGDVVERRLRLSASSFGRAVKQPLFWFSVLAIAAAVAARGPILVRLGRAPLARAGFAGAAAAVLLGVIANDSGATFLTIGSIGLLGCLAFAWNQAENPQFRVTDRTD